MAIKTCRFFRPSPQKLIKSIRGLQEFKHSKLSGKIEAHYQGCCNHKLAGNPKKIPSKLEEDINALVEHIWKTKQLPKTLNQPLLQYFAEQLSQAVVDGFGGSLQTIDYTSTDGAMVSNLLTDVYQFSAAKNYQQMAALTQALVNDDGKLRTRSEFLQEAFKINTDHVISWLDTERNTAIAGGQMASKWADIQANKDALPLLEFDAVIDGTTTELCDSLNGTIKPVDDPFWNTYYPPNHFNCRSSVRQLSDGKITADHAIVYPEKMPPMFATNLAKDGLIFPAEHPYWNGVPKDVLIEGILVAPYDVQFEVLNHSDEGILRRHILVDTKASDYKGVENIGAIKAANGDKVDIMPALNDDQLDLWKVIYKGGIKYKCPDLNVNNVFLEVESSTNSVNINNIKHAIDSGSDQANHVTVITSIKLDNDFMKRIVKGRFLDHKNLKTIEFQYKHDDKIKTFKREDFIK